MTPNRRRPPRRRRGMALMMVVVYTTLVLSIWSVANRQAGTLIRIREAHQGRMTALMEHDAAILDPRLAAMARGVDLLARPGFPADLPADLPAAFRADDLAPGFAVEHVRSDAGDWAVTARTRADGGDDEWDARAASDAAGSPPDFGRIGLGAGLDLVPGLGALAGQPIGRAFAREVGVDVDPDPVTTLLQTFIIEFVKVGPAGSETWLVTAWPEGDWQAIADPSASDHRREATGEGLALLRGGNPPPAGVEGDPATYRCVVQVGPSGSTPFTLTFVELTPGAGPWLVSASPWDAEADAGLGPPGTFE